MFEPTVFENRPLIADTVQPVNRAGGYIMAALKAGSVLCSTVKTAAAKAKKSITFTGAPISGKTVSILLNGAEIAYTTGSTTLATEITGIANAINAAAGDEVTASASAGKLSIEAKANGLNGNTISIVAVVEGSGLTAGAVAIDVVGCEVGDEVFEIVDSTSETNNIPCAVLLEDAEAGEIKSVAFTGCFISSALKFKAGQSLASFKKTLRTIGIFTKGSI